MNYKIRHIIRIGQRSTVLRGQTDFSVICGGRKRKIQSGHTSRDTCKGIAMDYWRKACSVCKLARALRVNRGRSMNIAMFSTRDLREQGRKS